MDINYGLGASIIPQEYIPQFFLSLVIISLAILILTGLALYKAARLNEKVWFWLMLVLNTLGILPLIYLYIRRGKNR